MPDKDAGTPQVFLIRHGEPIPTILLPAIEHRRNKEWITYPLEHARQPSGTSFLTEADS
jgi:hypothetical protein